MAMPKGTKLSNKHKRKISESHKGKKLSDEHKLKLSLSHMNPSTELRKKLSESAKRAMTDERKEKLSKLYKGRKLSDTHKESIKIAMNRPDVKERCGNSMRGKTHSEETKQKISESEKGRIVSEDTKRKMRLATIKRIEDRNGVVFPNYNKNSIPILEAKAKELGITDLQHAENGGEFHIKELGYWVDGYSSEKNMVIEYYEKFHSRRKEKDELRKQEIINHLGCVFIEICEND